MQMTVGKRLRAARRDQGLTQQQLASISKVKQGTISGIERGFLKKSTFLVALADALGIDPIWLDTGENRKKDAAELTAMEREIITLLRGLDQDELRREISYLQKISQKHLKI